MKNLPSAFNAFQALENSALLKVGERASLEFVHLDEFRPPSVGVKPGCPARDLGILIGGASALLDVWLPAALLLEPWAGPSPRW